MSWLHHVALLTLAGILATSCGYRFAGRVAREQSVAVQVHSASVEPGLALATRRALAAVASRAELDLTDLGDEVASAAWRLDVIVVSAEARPIGAVHVTGDDGAAVTGTTTWQVDTVLEAELVALDTDRAVATRVVVGQARFEDAGLGLWTDDARQRATERALGVACDRLGDWLVMELAGATEQ